MPTSDEHRARRRAAWLKDRRHAESATLLGLAALWGTALVQFWRPWAWGVIWLPTRHGGDRLLSGDPMDFWVALCTWAIVGPGSMIGIGIFLWIGRNDPIRARGPAAPLPLRVCSAMGPPIPHAGLAS